ncbi:hypothetical protein JCM16303_005294 [Sporobolomyces ruberrimus]
MLRRNITPTRPLTRILLHRPVSTSSYLGSLRRRYPAADPPSLVISFLILHELTAIVPLSVLFGTFHYLGLGAGIVAWTLAESESTDSTREGREEGTSSVQGAKTRVRKWVSEGEEQAERLGRRYGWFGWEKESKEERVERKARQDLDSTPKELSDESLKVTGDVANVAAAYLIVKALIPLRILISLRLTPSLANVIVKRFKGLRERGSRMLKRSPEVKP